MSMPVVKSSPLRAHPITRRDLCSRSALEVILLAYCYGKAAAGEEVSIRDLASLPGPSGREVGTGPALAAVQDLTDDGLVHLRGLDRAGLDQALTVLAPGQRPVTVTVGAALGDAARSAPPWSTGERALGLWIPKNLDPGLADEIKRVHWELNAFNKTYHGKRCPLDAQHTLMTRRAAVLARWLQRAPANKAVAAVLAKAQTALADIRRQCEARSINTDQEQP